MAKILCADDDDMNRRLYQGRLLRLGHQAVVAEDGEEAYNLWDQAIRSGEPFPMAFFDGQMPRCTGDEAYHRIREQEKLGGLKSRLPIVFITGGGRDSQIKAILNDDPLYAKVLIKPVGLDDFRAVISQLIDLNKLDGQP